MPLHQVRNQLPRFTAGLVVIASLMYPPVSFGQLPPATITSSGLNTDVVRTDAVSYTINGGMQVGTNLFHSFGEFSVPTSGSAIFNGPVSTTNVFSRVTGGQLSTIDGLINSRAAMPTANFFLINPAGVIFGPGASIEVGGTFHASSSDRIIFPNGEFSNTTVPGDVLLLTAPPQAFGFLESIEPIRTDGTLGTVVDSDGGGNFLISGGTYRETSLFHSFGAFSVPEFGSAIFDGLPATQNVISRVTGVDPSTIDGTISTRTAMPTANFFFINPAGIMFGPAAFLDIGGSVYFSTADRIIHPDQVFSAAPQPNDMRLLSSAAPQGFGFLADDPAGIDVIGAPLVVDPHDGISGRTLSLVGGNVNVLAGGVLFAPGGVVQIVGVASPGTVNLNAPDLGLSSFANLGTVTIGDLGIVAAGDGSSFGIPALGGTVVIRSGRLVMQSEGLIVSDTIGLGAPTVGVDIQARESVVVDTGGLISTSTSGADKAGDISIVTSNLSVTGGSAIESVSRGNLADGASGAINLDVGSAHLTGGRISTISQRSVAGNLSLTATGTVTLSGPATSIATGTQNLVGDVFGGDISISATDVVLTDRASIRSGAVALQGGKKLAVNGTNSVSISGLAGITSVGFRAEAGAIEISTPRLLMDAGFINASTLGAGGAGRIDVKAGSVTLVSGAQIASNTQGAATNQAGSITVDAGSLTIIGRGPATGSVGSVTFTNDRSSGIFSASSTIGTGKAGSVTLLTPMLTLADGAKISVTTTGVGDAGTIVANVGTANITGGARVDSSTTGSGAGGAIEVNGVLSISGTGSGLFSTASNAGDAGAIMITAPTLTLADGGRIAVTTTAAADAGTVTANVGSFNINGGARVDSSTTAGGAGGAITVNGPLSINGAGSGLFSTAAGTGNAGTITVTGSDTTLAGGGRIDSSTTGGGAGGAVQANGNLAISGAGSGLFSTASGAGDAGSITVAGQSVGLGDGGRISVTTIETGDAGTITANVGSFTITGGGRVDSSTTAGGAGGAIAVNGTLSISGAGSGLFSTASSTGNAGAITVTGPTVALTSGGAIDSSTGGAGTGGAIAVNGTVSVTGAESGLFSTASGAGSAGVINVTGPSLIVASGGTIDSSTTGAGAGGAIDVDAANQVEITGGGSVRADSLGSGNTGSIKIAAGDRIIMEHGSVSTRAATSDGGDITLLAPNVIRLTDSQITTSVESGTGGGGNIFIDPQLVLMQGSSVTANAFGGPGGNITLVANSFVTDAASVVEASSALSTPGTVRIQSPDDNLAEAVAQLPKELVDASRLMQGACSARRAGAPSSFTVGGRGGVPADPDGYLPSYSAAAPVGARASNAFGLAMAGWDCWRQQ